VLSVTHAPLWGSSPTALVVNDVSFLRGGHHYPLATRLRLRHLVARQVWSSAVVVTVSDFCRRDIIEAYGLPPGRVVTVPNCIEPPRPLSGPEEVEAEAWLGSRGVRGHLGNIHPRKNVPLLVRSFARALRDGSLADHQLVLAGGSWWGDDLDRQLQCTTPGTVIRVGRVSDIQREFLLRRAVALAYLAVHEGFGLPPLQAMARGTPVLAARSGAVPEVVGDGAFLVDPEDEEAVRDGLVRVVADDDLRDFLTDRGRERAAGFGPHRSGPAIHAALSTAASAGRRRSGPAVWARIHRSRYAPVDERRIAATGGTDGPRREPTRPDQDDTRGDRRLPGRAAAGHPVLDQP
jgi:glycosyltransferase involved in cell wall biosynthesis